MLRESPNGIARRVARTDGVLFGVDVAEPKQSSWNFLTNHGHVLVYVAGNPNAKIRLMADAVGVTDRATQTILSDLVAGGYVTKQRVGRRNAYRVHPELRFRHPAEADHSVGELLQIFAISDGP